MLVSQYESLAGKEKMTVNEEKRWRGLEKRCAFKGSVSCLPGLTTVSAKKQKKRPRGFLSIAPSPHRGLTWFHKEPHLPPQWTTWFVYRPNVRFLNVLFF